MLSDYHTKTHGKWILAGEHAVLREGPALVFPLKSCALSLSYQQSHHPFKLEYEGESTNTAPEKVTQVLQRALKVLDIDLSQLTGTLQLNNDIPIGTGLGASAALTVAIARWLKSSFRPDIDVFHFAHELEHLLHGKSSGLDVAGSMATTGGIYFENGTITEVTPAWQPHFELTYSGNTGDTAECIQKVEVMQKNNPVQAALIDEKMRRAVQLAKNALTTHHSISNLAEAMQKAAECFYVWGLVNDSMQAQIDALLEAGALAVKPTGSGCGGYILSLWEKSRHTRSVLAF